MTDQKAIQKQAIINLRVQGLTYAEIAAIMEISPNTVKSYCQRHNAKPQKMKPLPENTCKNCGKPLEQKNGTKKRTFCSNKCRYDWWNQHRSKYPYHLVCHQCGREFISFGNRNRKYCGRECYLESRYGEGLP